MCGKNVLRSAEKAQNLVNRKQAGNKNVEGRLIFRTSLRTLRKLLRLESSDLVKSRVSECGA